MTITRRLKERIYSGARPLFRRYLDEELGRLLPLAVQYQRYLESPPGDRQALYDHTQEPAAHLPLFGSLPARLAGAGVPVEETRVDLADFEAWRGSHPGLDRFYRSFGDIHIEKCLEHYLVDRLLGLAAGEEAR